MEYQMLKMNAIKAVRKLSRIIRNSQGIPFQPFTGHVELFGTAGNDAVHDILVGGKPAMIAKFGTVELGCLENYFSIKTKLGFRDTWDYIQDRRKYLDWWDILVAMEKQAGFFPANSVSAARFCELMLEDIRHIDVLGSYISEEEVVADYLGNARRVQLESYYAPFLFKNPWTECLKGKKVLVVHPFEASIQQQYKKRTLLFENPQVLPDFHLLTLKAVQSIAGNPTEFSDWFQALDWMKGQISNMDFDVALIGCGAYGLSLAAHVKRMGKQAVHLAGWTQILFGIYGTRWLNDAVASKYINEHWVRPLIEETPAGHGSIENGCYW